MKTIGIDPAYGKQNAYSVLDGDKAIEYGKFNDLSEWSNILYLHNPDMVIIEDQHLDKNVDVLKRLARVSGELAALAKIKNIDVKYVNATSWMHSINANRPRSRDRDEWIISVAKGLICQPGFFKLSIDEACAINIAHYGARHFNERIQ